MGLTGLEPVTFRLSAECSNQLSYKPKPEQTSVSQKEAIIVWLLYLRVNSVKKALPIHRVDSAMLFEQQPERK